MLSAISFVENKITFNFKKLLEKNLNQNSYGYCISTKINYLEFLASFSLVILGQALTNVCVQVAGFPCSLVVVVGDTAVGGDVTAGVWRIVVAGAAGDGKVGVATISYTIMHKFSDLIILFRRFTGHSELPQITKFSNTRQNDSND